MNWSDRYAQLFQRILPAPFTIAVVLTFLTFILALLFTENLNEGFYFLDLVSYWESGLWDRGLIVFAFQMMLMLVLGHALALTKQVSYIIDKALVYCDTTARAALTVTLLSLLVALFNWGLGLIFGAIFARKVGEHAHKNGLSINYPLVGAAGYSGLMVWHGGISGSSLVKVAEAGHMRGMMEGIYTEAQLASIPMSLPFSETVFSGMNISLALVLLIILPLSMYWMGRQVQSPAFKLSIRKTQIEISDEELHGAERLNHAPWMAFAFAAFVFIALLVHMLNSEHILDFTFMTPDFINLGLLFLCLMMHRSFQRFLQAVDSAVLGAAGILIQFPLYFGIMGIMKESGMVEVMSQFFVDIANEFTFPIFTFFSAAIVNVFVPSGGGQWAVQGPVIIQTANEMGIPLSKCILAMAYGDQLTNMLQPFWALPLLGITGLKAKEILPYTLFLMLIGGILFLLTLVIF